MKAIETEFKSLKMCQIRVGVNPEFFTIMSNQLEKMSVHFTSKVFFLIIIRLLSDKRLPTDDDHLKHNLSEQKKNSALLRVKKNDKKRDIKERGADKISQIESGRFATLIQFASLLEIIQFHLSVPKLEVLIQRHWTSVMIC